MDNIPKSLADMVLAQANLVESGMVAFRQKDFPKAIEIFNQAIDADKRNWNARLYLAMAYYSCGQTFSAAQHFRFLSENCLDREIHGKAKSALAAIEPELKRKPQFQPPQAPAKSDESIARDVEWVKQQ